MTIRRGWGVAAAFLLAPNVAWAHPGQAMAPHDLWSTWTLDFPLLGMLALAAAWYVLGVGHLWARAPASRGLTRRHCAAFAAGFLAILLALVSPIDGAGGALFTAHMIQHLLLVIVAAPLIVLGEPLTAYLWGLPQGARRAVGAAWKGASHLRWAWRQLRRAPVAWTLHVGLLLMWHLPRMYDLAMVNGSVHILEHALFLVSALLFWWVVFDRRSRASAGTLVAFLFLAMLQSTLLGAFLTMARRPLYFAHYGTTAAWGLTPLEDQQLAGLIMWIPAGTVYLIVLVPLVLRMLGDPSSPGGARAARGT